MYVHGAAIPLSVLFLNNKAGCITEGNTTDVVNKVLENPGINIRIEGRGSSYGPSFGCGSWTYTPGDPGSAYLNIVQPGIATVGDVDRYHTVSQAVRLRQAASRIGT